MQWMSCNCGHIFAIAIYNANGIIDDNFEIKLNGTVIGTIDNNHNNFTGRIFSEDVAFTSDKFGPQQPQIFEPTLQLDMSLLVNGNNTLEFVLTQNNNHGNFGLIKIGYWKLDLATPGFYDLETPPLRDTSYDGAGTYNFVYP